MNRHGKQGARVDGVAVLADRRISLRQRDAAGIRRGAADARDARPYQDGFPGAVAPSVGTGKRVCSKPQ